MMHADFVTIHSNFVRFFGLEVGEQRFTEFVAKYNLDVSRPYLVQVQLMRECLGGICESFSWARPLIQYLRADDEAKYYKVRALTANISMNRNDYTDIEELGRAARTLTGVPLNINHNHKRWLNPNGDSTTRPDEPESRVLWAEFEDNAVEAIIRIHNSDKWVQDALDNGDILNPSIEGDPIGGYRTGDGRFVPEWYNFTALALLEKDYALPGDPVTFGFEPLVLTESMGRSLVESLRIGEQIKEEKQVEDEIWYEYQGLTEAKWTTAYVNKLPNSSFAVVESCWKERKDARHLPYKDENGKIDLPHLRNALARMNQIKSVCGGSDERIRAAAKRKLTPLAKKHLPDSQWAKEELEEKTAPTPSPYQCGQCTFFEELLDKINIKPHAQAAGETDDHLVITQEGGVGPGIGDCTVAKILVRKNDAACSDGRPRDTPTSLERTIESVNELTMKIELEDTKAELLRMTNARNKEVEAHIETKKQKTESDDRYARAQKELTVEVANNDRLKKDNLALREANERLQDDIIRLNAQVNGLDKDVTFRNSRIDNLEDGIKKIKTSLAESQNELQRALTQAHNEAEKRAQANERARIAEEQRIRLSMENTQLTEEATQRTRELTESLQLRNESGKRELRLQQENQKLINKTRSLEDELTELQEKLKKIKRVSKIILK